MRYAIHSIGWRGTPGIESVAVSGRGRHQQVLRFSVQGRPALARALCDLVSPAGRTNPGRFAGGKVAVLPLHDVARLQPESWVAGVCLVSGWLPPAALPPTCFPNRVPRENYTRAGAQPTRYPRHAAGWLRNSPASLDGQLSGSLTHQSTMLGASVSPDARFRAGHVVRALIQGSGSAC